ncbi:hypothetical protein LAZ40_11070 [Cereibacter sphaeroides]|uniref:hypothetical protein n=1 Tax=Cereibacter sphaeroides TaxID=1063 RepID=UPI001F3E16ED|nr:hypothetical protein [Cereibacter sphaeroides]MCE6959597.1 hypothetical protein [Cereibacter sphaeroides]MCE6974543.1 hypothetical protein [Cereibacter sphaeroides]
MSHPEDDIFLPSGFAAPPAAPLAMPKQVLEAGWSRPDRVRRLLRHAVDRLASLTAPQIARS